MKLTEHRNEHELFMRRADAQHVVVIDRRFECSVIVDRQRVVENFPVRKVEELDTGAIDTILQLQPEVVLLGTGAATVFPPPSVLAQFLTRGIGLETMDNAAAARTFNVLAGEGRKAVAVFLLPG